MLLGMARVGHGKELLLEGSRMRRRGLRRLRDQRRAEKKHKNCGRYPLQMSIADRTLDPPGDFGSEHTDAMSARDQGWLMG